jgi:hypothetical protein
VIAVLVLALPAGAVAQVDDPDLTGPPLPRAPRRALTLELAIELADRGASDLDVLRLAVERGVAAERIAWAGLLPVITGALTYQRFDRQVERDGVVFRSADQLTGQVSVRAT